MTKKDRVMRMILESRGLEIRDVDNGDEPFLYSSGNRGPGYVDIKGRVGFNSVFETMVNLLVDKIIEDEVDFDGIVGMVTGGMLTGYRLKQIMSEILGRKIFYIYQRGARKEGGHKELDTGDRNNLNISDRCKVLVVEELINFAETTTNGVLYERSKGRIANDVATILFYQNPIAIKKLERNSITVHYVITLPELLNFAREELYFKKRLVSDYFEFLEDPKVWNEKRGFEFYG